ncbi:hypothetical protein J4Q44_G00024180 [Coregonus suidteri]|uniref:Voltage-dependent calcium channel gamma-7 subunit n=1 Tax=Coregonus suidteri TaxID=861788 RepID=A0AAN8M9P4_9TELE
MEEGIVLQQNQSMEVKMALHSGLWRVCFVAGTENGRCVASEYFTEPEIEITTENTANILKMVRTATPFPMVSLLFVFTAFVISNIGHIRPQRTILAFISGIFFILSGLSLVVGLVLYISSINDEVMNRPREPEQFFNYHYGWSFAFAASSFLLKEGAGVMSVYLFMKRYAEEEMYRPHPALYRPRLSESSDYSGQFLHPETWPPPKRGRSDSGPPATSPSRSTRPPRSPPKTTPSRATKVGAWGLTWALGLGLPPEQATSCPNHLGPTTPTHSNTNTHTVTPRPWPCPLRPGPLTTTHTCTWAPPPVRERKRKGEGCADGGLSLP